MMGKKRSKPVEQYDEDGWPEVLLLPEEHHVVHGKWLADPNHSAGQVMHRDNLPDTEPCRTVGCLVGNVATMFHGRDAFKMMYLWGGKPYDGFLNATHRVGAWKPAALEFLRTVCTLAGKPVPPHYSPVRWASHVFEADNHDVATVRLSVAQTVDLIRRAAEHHGYDVANARTLTDAERERYFPSEEEISS